MGMAEILITNNNNKIKTQNNIESTNSIKIDKITNSLKHFKFHDFSAESVMLLSQSSIMPLKGLVT